jgi:uncharacterized protein
MILEGQVTNVAAFGAFVDIGVHQDGLVHVSAMSRTFVSDPREVVKSGAVVKVKVLEVDLKRQRISLTLRLDDELPTPNPDGAPSGPGGSSRGSRPGSGARSTGGDRGGRQGAGRPNAGRPQSASAPTNSAMADALRRAGLDPNKP